MHLYAYSCATFVSIDSPWQQNQAIVVVIETSLHEGVQPCFFLSDLGKNCLLFKVVPVEPKKYINNALIWTRSARVLFSLYSRFLFTVIYVQLFLLDLKCLLFDRSLVQRTPVENTG